MAGTRLLDADPLGAVGDGNPGATNVLKAGGWKLGVAALFVWWTYAPPVLPIFIDPTNGTVGLPAIGM